MNVRKRRTPWLLGVICPLVAAGCTVKRTAPAPRRQPALAEATTDVTPAQLDRAIRLATGYLVRNCLPTGRFVYVRRADAASVNTRSYNVLRHAGATYALTYAYARTPAEDVRRAMIRAANYLRGEYVRPVRGERNMLAVWSPPGERSRADRDKPALAKLGGAGLALVALTRVRQAAPEAASLGDLRALARFLLRMQKPDGSFYCKYYEGLGPDDHWVSLYYPGEAALGLLTLDDVDPNPRRVEAAARGIGYLARSRAGRSSVPADHWALLATGKLLTKWPRMTKPPASRNAVIRHAEQICREILADRVRSTSASVLNGALVADGRTCPTATRLEGILAVLPFLPADQGELRLQVEQAAKAAAGFLVRSQLTSGDCRGGFPYAVRRLPDESRRRRFNARVSTVRIDYVQHALCALLEYEERLQSGPTTRSRRKPPARRPTPPEAHSGEG